MDHGGLDRGNGVDVKRRARAVLGPLGPQAVDGGAAAADGLQAQQVVVARGRHIDGRDGLAAGQVHVAAGTVHAEDG